MIEPSVGILILNWNGKEDTDECIYSLEKISYNNYKIIIVDNGSIDGSVDHLKKRFSEITIIENINNLGFAEGNNIGINYILENKMDYVLLLNNDTIVDKLFLSELVNVAQSSKDIGVVGPLIMDYRDRSAVQSAGIYIRGFDFKPVNIRGNKKDIIRFNELQRNFLTGCCLLIKSDVLREIGLFDPKYFAYWEDLDLCYRIGKKYKIICSQKSKIWHKGSASTGGYLNKKAFYYHVRNSIYFVNKNYSKIRFVFYMLYLLTIYFILLLGYGIINGRLDLLGSYLKGIKDAVTLIR